MVIMGVHKEQDAAAAVNDAMKMNQCEEVFHSGVPQIDGLQEGVKEERRPGVSAWRQGRIWAPGCLGGSPGRDP